MKTTNRNMQFNHNLKSARLAFLAALMLITFLTAAQALPLAGPNRPAAVPADFVITPFGYFHPSCVNHLAKGDVLLQDEKAIQRANGTHENIPQCAYPHFEADGAKVVGNVRPVGDGESEPPYIGHSWIEYASIHDSNDYAEIYAEWSVPPAPTSNDGQILYFFNGLEQYSGDVTIIQPVLGWNSDYASAWGIASWNCCVNGAVNEGTPAHANSGDQIEGYIVTTCSAGTKKCSSWDIVTLDDQNGNFSELAGTGNYGQTFNWAFGGVMEVYYITQCNDYPGAEGSNYGGALGFHNQIVLNYEYAAITPAWGIHNVSSGLSPQCNYGGSLPKQVTLTY